MPPRNSAPRMHLSVNGRLRRRRLHSAEQDDHPSMSRGALRLGTKIRAATMISTPTACGQLTRRDEIERLSYGCRRHKAASTHLQQNRARFSDFRLFCSSRHFSINLPSCTKDALDCGNAVDGNGRLRCRRYALRGARRPPFQEPGRPSIGHESVLQTSPHAHGTRAMPLRRRDKMNVSRTDAAVTKLKARTFNKIRTRFFSLQVVLLIAALSYKHAAPQSRSEDALVCGNAIDRNGRLRRHRYALCGTRRNPSMSQRALRLGTNPCFNHHPTPTVRAPCH